MKARRPRLRLDLIGIKPGDELVFSRDEQVRAVAVADGKVMLDGEILGPSAEALRIHHRMGYQTVAASGSEYWMFDGELLGERRRRLDARRFEDSERTAI